jgi:hypothetical protein
MRRAAGQRILVALPALAAITGCGGGAATMHPAHTLPTARVSVGAGVSSNFRFGSADTAVERGRTATSVGTTTANPEQDVIDGAVARATTTEGLAPWVGGRVGLDDDNEAGLTYTGRTARIDARHAFERQDWAVSLGLGASVLLLRASPAEPAPIESDAPRAGRITGSVNEFSATGWGLDVPIIVGWRSTGEVVQAWAGARGGFELGSGDLPIVFDPMVPLGEPGSESNASVDANRWYAGGLLGFAVGFRPFWIALELDVAYQSISGSATFPEGSADPVERSARATGLTMAPTGAVIGKF